ncbi:hypothetical protein SAMN02983003_3405 [Devosia enhydra]|uniref:Uncharacterized protein n=1 Tax=Devosia enhydra TaxID=665118 RepID=A0A1K2I1H6_9HYPH|nr:hypothetical protein SAMN02983003_3405 [Devosia enhydra]
MSTSDSAAEGARQREQRLAAKLRENLKRRKTQARARAEGGGQPALEEGEDRLPGHNEPPGPAPQD